MLVCLLILSNSKFLTRHDSPKNAANQTRVLNSSFLTFQRTLRVSARTVNTKCIAVCQRIPEMFEQNATLGVHYIKGNIEAEIFLGQNYS